MKNNDKIELRKLSINELEIALVDAQKKYLELRLTSSKEVIKNFSFLKTEAKKRIAVIKTFINEKVRTV
jgi:ribosomal protein L29